MLAGARCRARQKKAGESGYTLVEAVIVMATMMIVLGALLGVLQNLTNAGGRVQALIDNQERVRFALDQLGRDLRAANPVDALSSTTAYRNQVQVEVGPSSGSRQYIRWFYDTTSTSTTYEFLFRQVMSGPGPSATVQSQVSVVTRVHNIETATPVFTFYDSHDADLVTANATTPTNVANCVIRVHVQVNSDADPGPQPFSENIDVELRNRLPGGIIGCAG